MDELGAALNEMRAATELDPGFALAWSGLSDVINALVWRSPEYLSLVPEAKSAALRALALSPESPEAWASLGIIKAEVCDPNTLLLSTRHAKVRQRAEDAHREKWGGQAQEAEPGRRRRRRS